MRIKWWWNANFNDFGLPSVWLTKSHNGRENVHQEIGDLWIKKVHKHNTIYYAVRYVCVGMDNSNYPGYVIHTRSYLIVDISGRCWCFDTHKLANPLTCTSKAMSKRCRATPWRSWISCRTVCLCTSNNHDLLSLQFVAWPYTALSVEHTCVHW